jgi:plasmid replication protein
MARPKKNQSDTSQEAKKSVQKTRGYACVIYTDSAPEDWKERLIETHIPALISPYHDRDINADGTPKKPHYHVMIIFDGPRTLAQAEDVLTQIGAANGQVKPLNSITGYARYLCHLDNPDKVQYDQGDVVALAGAEYDVYTNRSEDKQQTLREMQDFVDRYAVYSFAQLLRYARQYNKVWYRHLNESCSYTMKEYLKSAYWEDQDILVHWGYKISDLKYRIVDPQTGEVVYDMTPNGIKIGSKASRFAAAPSYVIQDGKREIDPETGEIIGGISE